MLALLSLGFLIGISHAFEADHVAAVSSLVSGRTRIPTMIRHGAIWGVGHTTTLFFVGGAVLLSGSVIGPNFENGLEFVVGLMLLGLGGHVFYRLNRDRVHFHMHTHGDGQAHLHLHSHSGETTAHNPSDHHHRHPDGAVVRTLMVGMMHGMAGSASLVLVAAAAVTSPAVGLLYILLFGVGTILGMAIMSLVIALPLSYTAGALSRANTGLQLLIGTVTISVGLLKLYETSQALWG